MKFAALLLALSSLPACSRSANDTPTESTPTTSAPPSTAASSPEPSAPATPPPTTPEDVEEDAAHRITEQNLESELDRLEREIQAE